MEFRKTILNVGKIDELTNVLKLILIFVLKLILMDRDGVEVHKLTKKERGQYPAILTEQTWSIKDLLYGFW